MQLTEIGTVYDNRYQLTQSLGRDGFARAFLAVDLETQMSVLLKLPDLAQLGDPAVRAKLKRKRSSVNRFGFTTYVIFVL